MTKREIALPALRALSAHCAGTSLAPSVEGVDLNDVRARHDALEMITSVDIGDGVAAILQHDADAGDSVRGIDIDRAPAIGDTPDDRHTIRDAVARDANDRSGNRADGAQRIAGLRAVHRLAIGGVGADLEQVGQSARCRRKQ